MNVDADYNDQTVKVTYDDTKTSLEEMSKILANKGYAPAGNPEIIQ